MRSLLSFTAIISMSVSGCTADKTNMPLATPEISRLGTIYLTSANFIFSFDGAAIDYPLASTASGWTGGKAVIDCTVSAEGRPFNCDTVNETPQNSGLGAEAASWIPEHASLNRRRHPAQVFGNARVRFVLQWDKEGLMSVSDGQ